jgi:hypothetical protein
MKARISLTGARRHASKKDHNRPLIGGLHVTSPLPGNTYAEGSICVGAIRNGLLGFVTAGHVAAPAGTVFYQPRISNMNNWTAGTTAVVSGYAVNAQSDSAFLRDGTVPPGSITRSRIWRSANSQYTVAGVTVPVVNTAVFMQGAALAAERSGIICAVGATIRFADGGVLTGQCLASYRSREGDSGAPVYVKGADPQVSLIGLNVGATEPQYIDPPINPVAYPPADDGTYAIISPWANVAAELGVTL